MREYKNYIFLGILFAVCFAGAVHGSHDGDKELLSFSVDSAKQILAAILTVTTVAVASQRSTDRPYGGANVPSKTENPTASGTTLPTYPKS